jgi:hypothetical protein
MDAYCMLEQSVYGRPGRSSDGVSTDGLRHVLSLNTAAGRLNTRSPRPMPQNLRESVPVVTVLPMSAGYGHLFHVVNAANFLTQERNAMTVHVEHSDCKS